MFAIKEHHLVTRVLLLSHYNFVQSELGEIYPNQRYPLQVPWLLSPKHKLEFFAIPGDFCLNRTTSFQSGRVYGMDVTSGAAVAALLLDIYDLLDGSCQKVKAMNETKPLRVLDLCCAPG